LTELRKLPDESVNCCVTSPPELPERCIKAGTSEKGVCPKCGSPWVRIVERPNMVRVEGSKLDRFGNGTVGVHRKVGQKYQDWRENNPDKTVGWKQNCECQTSSPIPAIVLDPFFGAGTVGVVAKELGRDFIGIELNPLYVATAEARVRATGYQMPIDEALDKRAE
jgi:hypothetical protein